MKTGCRIFSTSLARFRKCGGESCKERRFPQAFERLHLVRILPPVLASIDVFRAALVSIVVTLTLGQNAAFLCSVWCHPQQSANSACEHQAPMTSPTVTGSESCV